MDFAKNTLRTPVPQVYAWSSNADNIFGAECIIMEKMAGVPLSDVWKSMKLMEKMRLLLDLAIYQERWLSVSFREFGALYYRQDLDSCTSKDEPLYTTQQGEKVHDRRFTIAPMTGRDWTDCGKAAPQGDRGPWSTLSGYYEAIGLREQAAIASTPTLPKQTVMVCGPGLYQPAAAKKWSAIESYLRIFSALLPNDPMISASSLWHNDLQQENIFVDHENPSKSVGIIDWQWTDLLPVFAHSLDSALIQYSGPKPDSLDAPELEDTLGMSNEER